MDIVYSVISLVLSFIIFIYLKTLTLRVNWGGAQEARNYVAAIHSLELLQGTKEHHVKNFRPQYLVMGGGHQERKGLCVHCFEKVMSSFLLPLSVFFTSPVLYYCSMERAV